MGLFRNSRRIAIQDRQAIAKTTGKSNKQGEECYFIEKKGEFGGAAVNKMAIEGNREFEAEWLSTG